MSEDDGGSRRRIRVVPFDSKFVDDPNDEQYSHINKMFLYKVNKTLKAENYRLPMMWLLMKKFEDFKREGLNLVPSIKRATDAYFKGQDLVEDWMEQVFEKDPDNEPDKSEWILKKKEVPNARTQDIKQHIKSSRDLLEILGTPSKLGPMIPSEVRDGVNIKDFWKGWRVKQVTYGEDGFS